MPLKALPKVTMIFSMNDPLQSVFLNIIYEMPEGAAGGEKHGFDVNEMVYRASLLLVKETFH